MIEKRLSGIIESKKKEIWVELLEVTDTGKQMMGKILVSHTYSKSDIEICIADALKLQFDKPCDVEYIRVCVDELNTDNLSQKNLEEKLLEYFLIDSNQIHFEILPFPK